MRSRGPGPREMTAGRALLGAGLAAVIVATSIAGSIIAGIVLVFTL
jgi:hypothetical protein